MPEKPLRTSLYCFATDVLDEGPDAVVAAARRAGVSGITVAAKYHAARDVFPHNPRRRVAKVAPGLFIEPDPALYDTTSIFATPSPDAAGRDVVAMLAAATGGLELAAWVVALHHDEAPDDAPFLQRTFEGEPLAGTLCPASDEVVAFAEGLVANALASGARCVRLESCHFHGLGHGHHHERSFEPLGGPASLALGLCFCAACERGAAASGVDVAAARRACRCALEARERGDVALEVDEWAPAGGLGPDVAGLLVWRRDRVTELVRRLAVVARGVGGRLNVIEASIAAQSYASARRSGPLGPEAWVTGLDATAIASLGAVVEVTGYLADDRELAASLAHYEPARRTGGELAVILRPGAPDCVDEGALARHVTTAIGAGASELNFYCYGAYRLEALDWIAAALRGARQRSTA